jgi:thiol:disulfide interchange protein DsbD
MKRAITCIGLLVTATGCGGSQAAPSDRGPSVPPDGRVVRVTVETPAPVAPGGHTDLAVTFTILPGFHIMSDRPSKPNYIATALVLDAGNASDVAAGEPRYPAPVVFALADESIRTFQGVGTVHVPLQVARDAAPGDHNLSGAFRYQACTDRGCLFPKSERFAVSLRIGPGEH